jgi:hypothetical protein
LQPVVFKVLKRDVLTVMVFDHYRPFLPRKQVLFGYNLSLRIDALEAFRTAPGIYPGIKRIALDR